MRLSFVSLGSALLLLGAPSLLPAQATKVIEPGDRVRVDSSPHRGMYVVTGVAESELVLADADGQEVRIPHSGLPGVRVDRGPRSRGSAALRGLAIGGGVGMIAGAAVGFAAGDDECASGSLCLMRTTAGEKALILGTLMGAAFGGVGAAIGAALPGHRWDAVELPVTMTGGAGAAGGVRLELRLAL